MISDLDDLQISRLLGNALADRIETVFNRNEFTLAVASDQITEIEAELNQLTESLRAAVLAFQTLGIAREEPAPGDVEASVILPRTSVDNSLGSLGVEFRELERVFADMTELATGSRPPTTVRSIASSDFSVYVELAPKAAAFLAVAVERVIALYRNLLEIRRIRSEAAVQGITDEQLEGFDEHIGQRMDDGLDETVEVLFTEMPIDVADDSRKNELRISLRRTLSDVATRIDRGYRFDVRVGESADDSEWESDEGEERSSLASTMRIIAESRDGLKFLRLEGDPILQLPSAESSEKTQEEE